MKKFVVGAVFLSASCVFADIIPTFLTPGNPSASVINPGAYTYTYTVSLGAGETVVSGPVPVNPTDTGLNVPPSSATYFTVYDFSGYVAGSARQPTGWTPMVQNTGISPNGFGSPAVTDNPTIANITWYYTGSTPIVGPTPLGIFTADSMFNLTKPVSFTSYSTKSAGEFAGTEVANQGTTTGPVGSVPEPGTYAMLGGGLIAIGALRRKA